MELNALAWQAVLRWLLLPAVGVPLGLVAHRYGDGGFVRRLGPWFVFVPLVLVSAWAGPGVFAALVAAGGLAATVELAALERAGQPAARLFCAIRTGVAVAAWLAAAWMVPSLSPTLMAAGVLAILAALLLPSSPGHHAAWRSIVVGCATGAGLAAWVVLRLRPDGFRFVIFVFSVVVVSDMLAYVGGRLYPRGRPFPSLSPQKTHTGYLAGLIGAILAGYLMWFAVPEWGGARIAGVSLLLGVAGATGDLAASAVKRRHAVKDFGRALGAHGGVLDRLDSLIGAGWVFVIALPVLIR